MALYAFDGTWNIDDVQPENDTNVVKFRDIYGGPVEYRPGVGTRWGGIGRALGGLLGMGGRTRIEEMYDELSENYRKGDHDIDIIGFSRGSSLAVHFSNLLADKGVKTEHGETIIPTIRFLGIWDLVSSFGINFDTIIDFQSINPGWNITQIPNNFTRCFHAMALEERRETFNVTRLNPTNQPSNVMEIWFRGDHSDVGDGNQNSKRSNIALAWMLQNALESGLPIRQEDVETVRRDTDYLAPFIAPKDLQLDPRRTTYDNDNYHESAKARQLAVPVNESFIFPVYAAHKRNWAGVYVDKKCKYRFDMPDGQSWMDGEISCGPDGWKSDQLPWYKEDIVRQFEQKRRCKHANWFELIGSLGDDDNNSIPIGRGGEERILQPQQSAELFAFANDLDWKYDNNQGKIDVQLTRIE